MDTAALLEQSVSKDQEVSRCDLCSDIHQRERREATYLPEKIEDIRTNGTTCPCCALISEGAYAVAKNCSAVFMDKDSFGGAYATEVSGRLVIAERRRGARTFSFYTLPGRSLLNVNLSLLILEKKRTSGRTMFRLPSICLTVQIHQPHSK